MPLLSSSLHIRRAAARWALLTIGLGISKQGTPKSLTEAHYILANTSLKFRALIVKFQGDMPRVGSETCDLVGSLSLCTNQGRTWRQLDG